MALQARREVEAASRASPRCSSTSWRKAAKEHSRAGPQTVGDRRRGAPQVLGRQAARRVRAHARAHARLARRLHVHEGDGGARGRGARRTSEDLPLSIVRPSIIESALVHPSPGWIDGFKMADPIIRAYGMGQIPEFPGIPEGIVDLIPVDYVVNAILAVAAHAAGGRRARPLQRDRAARNPLRFFELYEYVREYFEAHPLPERGRGEHKVPDVGVPRQPQGREDAPPRREADRSSPSRS